MPGRGLDINKTAEIKLVEEVALGFFVYDAEAKM